MVEAIFADPKSRPSEDELKSVLARTHGHWQRMADGVMALEPKAAGEWKFYKSGGWTYIIKDKNRNLLYLRPLRGKIMASTALGEEAYEQALKSKLPADVVAELREAPEYPEGRPARVAVCTAADAKTVLTLVGLKIAN